MRNNCTRAHPRCMGILVALATAVFASGCASISKPKVAAVSVKVPLACSGKVECTLANKKESRVVVPTGDVTIKKSDDPLRVSCADSRGNIYHTAEVAGHRTGRAWGNIILGGGVGGVIDAHTDAHWEYPGTVDVPCP